MAKKKPKPEKTKVTSKKPKPMRSGLTKVVIGFVILLLLVVTAAILTHYLILRRPAVETAPPAKELQLPTPPRYAPPTFEIYPKEKTPPPTPVPTPAVPPKELPRFDISEALPRVAIILDDLGYHKTLTDDFLDLDAVFTYSILPHSPYQDRIARSAQARGFEVMLHLPMEPLEYPTVTGGPGTLLTSMTPDGLIQQLIKNLAAVPGAVGVNNHMGSKMTTDSTRMNQIFTVLKSRGLFFIDSRTTTGSVGWASARLFQVPFTKRDVFIDHFQEPDFIRNQIAQLIRIAQNTGRAVGLIHPHQVTYDVIREVLPDLKSAVRLVPASDLVHLVK
ncbi:MAG: divergent polysaccharide deacetylase family protein [Desulfobacterales bacterium]